MANKVNVLSTTDSVQFLHRARAYLNRNEAENNTILSIAGQAGSEFSMLLPPFWFSLVETEEGDSGAAVYALPDGRGNEAQSSLPKTAYDTSRTSPTT